MNPTRRYAARAGALKSLTYSDTTGAIERSASTDHRRHAGRGQAAAAQSGRTQTPCTWHACGVTAPISALNITRPSSIRANARPARISSPTRAR